MTITDICVIQIVPNQNIVRGTALVGIAPVNCAKHGEADCGIFLIWGYQTNATQKTAPRL